MEKLGRIEEPSSPSFDHCPPCVPLQVAPENDPRSIRHAIDDYISLLDAVRDGPTTPSEAEIPICPIERSNNLKAFGYFMDASLVGVCDLSEDLILERPFIHPRVDQWFNDAKEAASKPIPMTISMAYMRVTMAKTVHQKPVEKHTHAIIYAYEFSREPEKDEPGSKWIQDLQIYRSSLRAMECAVAGANYLRTLGFDARAHSATSSDIDFNKVAIKSGIAQWDGISVTNPYIGDGFGLAVVTSNLSLAPDQPLREQNLMDRVRSKGPSWWLGTASHKNTFNAKPFKNRQFKDSMFPTEKIKTQKNPTSLVDSERIPRLPKRADFFQRSFIGDLGKGPRDASIDGAVVMKNPNCAALVAMLNTLVILQRAEENDERVESYDDPQNNADIIKATLHFLGADLVGISEAPDWVWYSHDEGGRPIKPAHKFAVTTLIDQGHETMEGASGDDYLSAAQSMRAYMRGSLLNGVVVQHLRRLGFPATNHTASDGDVIQPPLVLLSGLGEVSRIGDVMLNPFLGPRLKCGIITTDFPLAVDKPINFGLQTFCDNCNKCARECPSGAISAGKKVMFNGYEIWRSDAEKCTRYRMTNTAGSMCGRCMKTCPWNLEGIFKEAPFRFLATHFPSTAPLLSRIDDWLGNGSINPIKKWWWDLEAGTNGGKIAKVANVNRRELNTHLKLKAEDQTLACYPADIAPTPYMEPQPLDREAGIKAFKALRSPQEYKELLAKGEVDDLVPKYQVPEGPPPVFPVIIKKKQIISSDGKIIKFEFQLPDGKDLPRYAAGAHIDVMVAPQFIRQYSLCSDPDNPSTYSVAVLREDDGTGGSLRIHQRLMQGKMVMISRPRNHFPLIEEAKRTILMAGGIGVTPLIAMAHELYKKNEDFILYYKASTRASAGFVEELRNIPWCDHVKCYFSDENRLNVADVLGNFRSGNHLYTCGPSGFMDAVFASALEQGWEEDNLHREYFTVPGDVEYENHDFVIELEKSGQKIGVPADKSAADALTEAGFPIDVKCSDGLCGVCIADYTEGSVEHRDYVLSKSQQENKITLCCSRAAKEAGKLVIDL